MQRGKVKFSLVIVISVVMTMIFTSAVYSDSVDGWKGYGLYNISGSKISIINEDININLQNEKLSVIGEFLVRNQTNSTIKTSMGIPVQGIEHITLTEKNSTIKWKKRSFAALQNEFGIETRVPKEEWWYVFSVNLNPGETKLINIKFDAVQQQDEQGIYTFTYFNDRKLGFSNQVEKSSLYISFADFQPYNLASLSGIETSQVGVKGDIVLKGEADKFDIIEIKYLDSAKKAMDKLLTSPMYKPREIALAFTSKNYSKVPVLCDEYLKNPNDNQITTEEILFIKAESLRRLQNNEKYLEIVEALDYDNLYPAELKNKIYMDRISIYIEQQNQDKLAAVYKELELDATESTKTLKTWIENSSAYGAVQINSSNVFEQLQQETQKAEQPEGSIIQWYNKIIDYKFTPAILFVVGLILGFTLDRLRIRRKRKSRYIYRM